ncbi:MAG: methionyl-tRNA formyltransferase [Dokdonella sp.]
MPVAHERLRVVFAGTPEFAVASLRACLAAKVDVVAVYTQPDRPAGRGRKLSPSAVKQAARDAGVAVEQPQTLRTLESRRQLAAYRPDLLVVVAYGQILTRSVLEMPRHGCWNVHASLLPRWRGAAPIQRAMLAGDRETGVCLMEMRAGLDTGPVLISQTLPIRDHDTSATVHNRLATLGASVLGDGLARLARGSLPAPVEQAEDGVTYAHKLDKREAVLDWRKSAIELERAVRAFDPWPVAETSVTGERLRVWAACAIAGNAAVTPGSILRIDTQGIDVQSADGALRLLDVQRDGARRMSVRDWLASRPAASGGQR